MAKLPPQELDLYSIVSKAIFTYEDKIVWLAISKLFPNDKLDPKQIQVSMEKVKNYSVAVKTIRYRGRILLQKFPMDFSGMKYRYESPIYDNQ